MIYVHWIILTLYVLAVAGSMIAVLTDNRQPAKTMAWLLVLTFLPLLGIFLYFFFGRNTRKERYISEQSMDDLTKHAMYQYVEQQNLRLPEEHINLIHLFANQSMSLPFKDNHVDIFTTGTNFFVSLIDAIGSAKEHIHLESYIFDDDPLGCLVADALIDKAREGVSVRVIYDDVGCWRVSGRFFERMRQEGIDVRSFMPVRFPAFTGKVNYRNHRKICVVDGCVAFVGGMNIALRYVRGTATMAWRDTHMRISGGAVYALQRAFLIDWYFVDRTLLSGQEYYPPLPASTGSDASANDCIAQVVTSSPVSPWPDIMQGYVRILLEAKRYVFMQTPYFLPTEPILFAMRTAALSGVDVRLMVPRHCDARLIEWASRSYFAKVLEAGAKICVYEAGFNHSKMLVSDDTIATCGSTNIDFRSFENNFESNVFFYDTQMAQRFKQIFLADACHCTIIDSSTSLPRQSIFRRIWESLMRLFAPLL
ncbi:MAG: cardiolipin synthase [Prevotella sp.]|nr:cardiolipin synthase [Prevotella sp.]